MYRFGVRRLDELGPFQVLALALMGGALMTVGALASILLGVGVASPGIRYLLAGVGFSSGLFLIVLSEAALFTEANVVLPAVLLRRGAARGLRRIAIFWTITWLGNLTGAWLFGQTMRLAGGGLGPAELAGLASRVALAAHAAHTGTPLGTWSVVLSGIVANWLVGMAAFLAGMGRTILGKYLPVLLGATLFVTLGVQHAAANMGYFALAMPEGVGPGWGTAISSNLLPASLGNVLGGLLVALGSWFVLRPRERAHLLRIGPH